MENYNSRVNSDMIYSDEFSEKRIRVVYDWRVHTWKKLLRGEAVVPVFIFDIITIDKEGVLERHMEYRYLLNLN